MVRISLTSSRYVLRNKPQASQGTNNLANGPIFIGSSRNSMAWRDKHSDAVHGSSIPSPFVDPVNNPCLDRSNVDVVPRSFGLGQQNTRKYSLKGLAASERHPSKPIGRLQHDSQSQNGVPITGEKQCSRHRDLNHGTSKRQNSTQTDIHYVLQGMDIYTNYYLMRGECQRVLTDIGRRFRRRPRR